MVIKRLKSVKGRRDFCLVVLSNSTKSSPENILDAYSIRWKIERAFLNLESNGWQLKKTHLKSAKRIEMMFYILILCYYLSVLFGYICICLRKVKNKKHGYVPVTLFLKGRRLIDELFTRRHVLSVADIGEYISNLLYNILPNVVVSEAGQGVV